MSLQPDPRGDDRAAILELLDLYHATINFRDFSLLPKVFAADAVWEIGPPIGVALEGLPAIEEGFRASVGRQDFLIQTGSGAVIEFDGPDTARVRSTLIEFGEAEPGQGWFAVLTFDDRAMRGEDGWRLQRRQGELRRHFAAPLASAPV